MNSFNISPDLGYSTSFNDLLNGITINNPLLVLIVLLILILYYLVFSSMNVNITSPNINTPSMEHVARASSGLGFIEISLWGLFIFLLLINGLQMFLSIDVKAIVKDIFSPQPKVDLTVSSPLLTNPNPLEKEVFHIPDNKYSYEDAKAMCKAFNADLATYDQVNEAHKKGAEWCSYGWSKDQLALYPTQKQTYDKLKTIKGHEHDCGRPGINGGYIDNKNTRFGVNCYGYKPEITPAESERMRNTPLYPTNQQDEEREKRAAEFKKQIKDVQLAPFNKTQWTKI